jgi:hypothetical protein
MMNNNSTGNLSHTPSLLSATADMGSVCLSLALILGNLQLLMLMNKKNIAIVMISTASSVVVCGLAAIAPFLSPSLTRRCYQTSIPCIIWLFWQATQSHFFTFTHGENKRHASDTKI